MDPSWQVPMLDPEDVANFQIQPNLWRRVMVHQGGEKVWRLEFHEATDAYRGFFFQVAFQVRDFFNCILCLNLKLKGTRRLAEFRVYFRN